LEHPVQLEEVQLPQPEDPAEEWKSSDAADPLLKPKVDISFFIFFFPHSAHSFASSDMLRAKCSKVSPQASHLYS
jgi:hypothetical protein